MVTQTATVSGTVLGTQPSEAKPEEVKVGVQADGSTVNTVGPYPTASVTNIDKQIDQKVSEAAKKIILANIKGNAGLTRDVFNLIRSCDDLIIAKHSMNAAEDRVVKMFDSQKIPGEKKIKSLRDVAMLHGIKQFSWTAVKSQLFSVCEAEDELCEGLQAWWNYEAKHDEAPIKTLPEGFLNLYSKRYGNEKQGWAVFTRDARTAKAGMAMHANRLEQDKRTASKKAGAETGENGEQTQQGLASGTRQRPNLPEDTQALLNKAIDAVHEASGVLSNEVLNGLLVSFAKDVSDLLTAHHDAVRETAAHERPNEAVASTQSGTGDGAKSGDVELPDVTVDVFSTDDEELSDEDKANIEEVETSDAA